jgi:hypothetical protein
LAADHSRATPPRRPGAGTEPSLRDKLSAILAEAYGDALLAGERETGLSEATFPATCPWPFEQVMDEAFWPETIAQ